jgi:CheY-like chemotaxis protein
VGEIGREVLSLLSGRAREKGLELALQLDAATPPSVMLDADRLRQVLLNLAGNAVKSPRAGRVTLSIALADDGAGLRFAVADTGIGLDAEQCAQLFQRFNQIDGSTTPQARRHRPGAGHLQGPGRGDGRHGRGGEHAGRGGSVFHIGAAGAGRAGRGGRGRGRGRHGLDRRVERDGGRRQPHQTASWRAHPGGPGRAGERTPDSGAQALAQTGQRAGGRGAEDLRMPDMDGREALARLRAQPGPNQACPALAFTADAEVGDRARLEAFDGVIRKPIDPLELAAGLARAVADGGGNVGGVRASA